MLILASSAPVWFGAIFAAFGGLFMLGGAISALRMGTKLRTYRAVPATVIASEVVTTKDSEGSISHTPVVRYIYHPGGAARESDVTTVLKYAAGGGWAKEVVARYPPGLQTQAYVDPLDDGKVFLVHEPMSAPYVGVLVSTIFLAFGLGIVFMGRDGGSMSVSDCILIGTLAWFALTLACMGHYRWIGGRMSLTTQVGFMFCLGIGFILLMVWQDYRADELANGSSDPRHLNPRPSSSLPIETRGVA